jgi:hypothetical protein
MPTKRRAIVRRPSTWIGPFVAYGIVPRVQDDPTGWKELNGWCLGELVPGLPDRHSPEGRHLIEQAAAKGWTSLR